MVVVGVAERILVILLPMHTTRAACGTELSSLLGRRNFANFGLFVDSYAWNRTTAP